MILRPCAPIAACDSAVPADQWVRDHSLVAAGSPSHPPRTQARHTTTVPAPGSSAAARFQRQASAPIPASPFHAPGRFGREPEKKRQVRQRGESNTSSSQTADHGWTHCGSSASPVSGGRFSPSRSRQSQVDRSQQTDTARRVSNQLAWPIRAIAIRVTHALTLKH